MPRRSLSDDKQHAKSTPAGWSPLQSAATCVVAIAVFAIGPVLDRLLPRYVFDALILARIPVCAFLLGFWLPRGFPGASVGMGLAMWYVLTNLPPGPYGVAGKSIIKAVWWLVPLVALVMEASGSWLRRNLRGSARRD